MSTTHRISIAVMSLVVGLSACGSPAPPDAGSAAAQGAAAGSTVTTSTPAVASESPVTTLPTTTLPTTTLPTTTLPPTTTAAPAQACELVDVADVESAMLGPVVVDDGDPCRFEAGDLTIAVHTIDYDDSLSAERAAAGDLVEFGVRELDGEDLEGLHRAFWSVVGGVTVGVDLDGRAIGVEVGRAEGDPVNFVWPAVTLGKFAAGVDAEWTPAQRGRLYVRWLLEQFLAWDQQVTAYARLLADHSGSTADLNGDPIARITGDMTVTRADMVRSQMAAAPPAPEFEAEVTAIEAAFGAFDGWLDQLRACRGASCEPLLEEFDGRRSEMFAVVQAMIDVVSAA